MTNRLSISWHKVISATKTPIGLLALSLLVINAVLLVVASRANGINLTIVIVGIILLLFYIIHIASKILDKYSVVTVEPKQSSASLKSTEKGKVKYDVFLSSPMASLNDEQYKSDRSNTMKVVECLRRDCKKSNVYYAGEFIETRQKFEPESISISRDFNAIEGSEIFILILYSKVVSSVLFEAGIALALGKTCIYFVRNRNHLPFLMKFSSEVFANISIYEFTSHGDIIYKLKDVKVLDCKKNA